MSFRAGYTYLDTKDDASLPLVYDNNETYRFNYYRMYPRNIKKHGAYVYSNINFNTLNINHKLTLGLMGLKDKTYLTQGAWEWVNLGNYILNDIYNIGEPNYRASVKNPQYLSSKNEKLNLLIGDDITFNEKWSTLLGLNYVKTKTDSFTVAGNRSVPGYSENATTPTISVIYKPVKNISSYITYMESLENGTVVGSSYSNAGETLIPQLANNMK